MLNKHRTLGSANSQAFQLSISEQTLRRFYQLIFVANGLLILVTAASDVGFTFGWRDILQLDLKLEGNIAVWYSSTLLFLTALATLAISTHVPPQVTQPRLYRLVWGMATLFFLGLAIDETAELHERAGVLFTKYIGDVPGLTPGSAPVFAWLVVLAPMIIVFLVVMKIAVQWLRLHNRSRSLALAGIACWIGVLLAEFIQVQMRRLSMTRSIQGVIEEGLEIIGTTLFLISFLEFLRYIGLTNHFGHRRGVETVGHWPWRDTADHQGGG